MGRPGSPPRVRGTAPVHPAPQRGQGITPARAGNRQANLTLSQRIRDHPRACGEQLTVVGLSRLPVGSPPRVRGTDNQVNLKPVATGITPARAGNSIIIRKCPGNVWDHPRACGEQDILDWLQPDWVGSPPRVRGTDLDGYDAIRGRRITPARAGNRKWPLWPPWTRWDHPRACGEQSSTIRNGRI